MQQLQPSSSCCCLPRAARAFCHPSSSNWGSRLARQRQPLQHQHPHRRHQPAAAAGEAAGAAASAPAASAAPAGAPNNAQLGGVGAIFEGLCAASGIDASGVTVRPVSRDKGVGLFASRPLRAGEVILRVPASLAVIIDNASGSMTIPAGDWPRLSGGLMQDNALTWDVLQGLALMDAIAGDGDRFFEVYAEEMLPQPEDLALPMCWPVELLQQLQHPGIIQAAREQQARLRELLPAGYMDPISPGLPSYLQWGFACVRSRAFQLGPQAFGLVPFLDFANHADEPNADLRVVPAPGNDDAAGSAASTTPTASEAGNDSSSDSSGGSAQAAPPGAQGVVELVALADVAPGSELNMSYCGAAGFTNQRWMAQYGFVPAGGNAADRLEWGPLPEGAGLEGAQLRLSHVEDALGSGLLLRAAQGDNAYLVAALKSLPLLADDVSEADAAAASGAAAHDAGGAGDGGSSGGRGIAAATPQEKALAGALLAQVDAELAAAPTTLAEDEQLLLQLSMRPPALPEGLPAELAKDPRLLAAVKYRVERKRLLAAAQVVLGVFVRD